jgi:hypothetical protein
VIRVRHLTLPAGLSAVVRKDSDGGLQVFVSDTLAADRQRAAVRLALRSIDRPSRRAGLLPVAVGLLLGTFRRSIMPIARAVRSHAIATSAGALLLTAGAAALTIGLTQHHGPALAGQGPGHGQVHAPVAGQTHAAGKPGTGHNPGPGATAVAHRSAGTPPGVATATPAPQSAAPSASQPVPAGPSKSPVPPPSGTPSPTQTPASSPSPSASGGAACLVLLGVWVCL